MWELFLLLQKTKLFCFSTLQYGILLYAHNTIYLLYTWPPLGFFQFGTNTNKRNRRILLHAFQYIYIYVYVCILLGVHLGEFLGYEVAYENF